MNVKKIILGAVLLALCAAALTPAPLRAQSGNLLQNAGMNQPYADGNKQASSWTRWFQVIEKPGDASALNYALNPNFSAETNPSGKFPQLVMEGDSSQHIGRQYDPWIGGIQQTVGGIPAGSQVRFCAHSRLYAQNSDLGKEPSVSSLNGRSQVGVFLNGETTWDNAGIVWSGQANPHDTWNNLCVTAGPVGETGKVTVFTKNDWRGSGAIHLDSWWDQAELVILGAQQAQPTAAPDQPQPTAAPNQPQPTTPPQPLPTADASGGVVHTVAAGDTLFGLSFQYDVPLDQIYTLNGLNAQSILSIGQKIIIKAGAGAQPVATAAPTTAPAQPEATPAVPAEGTPAAPAEGTATAPQPPTPAAIATQPAATGDKGQLCLLAFDDTNADGLRQSAEGPVAGATFTIVDGQGAPVQEYVSLGDAQPYCITDLTPGSYNVSVQPAPDTTATSDKRWGVPLTSGSTVNINFGSRGSTDSSSGDTSGSTDTGESTTTSKSGGSNVGGLVLGIGGLVLLLAAGVVGAFVIARRRA